MRRYAALLRGIAPSGRNMTNDKLRGVFERLGFDEVASVLASGNIVFRSELTDVPVLERRIEDSLAAELGLSSRTIVRDHRALRGLVDSDPFHGLTHGDDTYLIASFLKHPASAPGPIPEMDPGTRLVRYDPASGAVLAVIDNTAPERAREFMKWLDASFGKDVTTRSWLTVHRVVRKLEG
jgi:uncharacterized protein (DUF1697 family)